jgi:hypothetical protein
MTGDNFNWSELNGMSEERAEDHMIKKWGRIPPQWNDPLFRDSVTQISGQAEIGAHMNFGELTYGGDKKLGKDARGVWDRRNVDGQGHPGESNYKNSVKGENKG